MKKTKNGRDAYFIVGMCLAFLLLFILLPGVVCLITYRTGNSDTAKVNRALQAYHEFLRGERSVGNEDVYQESDDALEQIRRGDFTSLRGLTETELEELERIYGNYRDSQRAEMIYADINGDGASELIWQEKDDAGIESVHRILAVFTVVPDGVRRIVWDVGDMGEFYFRYHDKIIYTAQYLGPYGYYYYGICECGTNGELGVIKSFEVYDLRELTEEESRDFLAQYDWAKDIPASDHGEEKVYYVAGTRSSNVENVKSLMKKDEWMEQVMCEVGFVDLEEMD